MCRGGAIARDPWLSGEGKSSGVFDEQRGRPCSEQSLGFVATECGGFVATAASSRPSELGHGFEAERAILQPRSASCLVCSMRSFSCEGLVPKSISIFHILFHRRIMAASRSEA